MTLSEFDDMGSVIIFLGCNMLLQEMLNVICVTPDCEQLIIRIRYRDSSGRVVKEVSLTLYSRCY